jgi:hypothetical protein
VVSTPVYRTQGVFFLLMYAKDFQIQILK